MDSDIEMLSCITDGADGMYATLYVYNSPNEGSTVNFTRTPLAPSFGNQTGLDLVAGIYTTQFGLPENTLAYYSGDNRDYCALPGNTAELSDCYELYDSGRTIFMNPTAFSDFCGDDTQSPVLFHGTLDGKPYAAQIVCTPNLPKTEAFAAVAVSEAELRDADTLRLCLTDRAMFSPESIGLTVQNPEVQTAAAYEEQLVLLRIRFAAFAVFLAMVAAGAFLHIYKLQHKNA